MDRQAALADFDVARAEWEEAFARVPDAGLTYLKPGDDYSLGGLMVHVNWVLARYLRVLEGEVVLRVPALSDLARTGPTALQRQELLGEMARLHAAVVAIASRLDEPAWRRVAPVTYAPGEDPFPTSPADVVGWLSDHYREHVEQCGDLVREWSSGVRSTAGG